MVIKFSNDGRGTHPYFTAAKAADFLPLVYQLLQQPPGQPFTIHCKSRTRLTVRQMLAYGRQYIVHSRTFDADHADAGFQPLVDTVKPIRIGANTDPDYMLSVTAPDSVHAMYLSGEPHPLFSAFTVIGEWLRLDSSSQLLLPIPNVAACLRPAFLALPRYRPNLDIVSLADDKVVLTRKANFFSVDA